MMVTVIISGCSDKHDMDFGPVALSDGPLVSEITADTSIALETEAVIFVQPLDEAELEAPLRDIGEEYSLVDIEEEPEAFEIETLDPIAPHYEDEQFIPVDI